MSSSSLVMMSALVSISSWSLWFLHLHLQLSFTESCHSSDTSISS
jgi:hypothetical protein